MFLTWFSLDSVSFDIGQANGLDDANLRGLPTTEFQFTEDELNLMVGDAGRSRSAWEALGAGKIMLVAAALAAIALLVASLRGVAIPRLALTAVAALGTLGALFVLYRLINPPDLIGSGGGGLIPPGANPSIGIARGFGVWIGFLTTVGVAGGGFLALSESQK